MNRPKLSVVVVGYNMARELPRTIRSLSPPMQIGIAADDYEIILVDNGSTKPFAEAECRRWFEHLTIHYVANASPSPVNAINQGIALARGDLIGVFIDGARMASPGLLRSALMASRLHKKSAIGALAFHLGPEVYPKGTMQGYNQEMEDALLASSGWEEDGYRLFGISRFAGSSKNGWFVLPAETNSLFLKATHWAAVGGYDPAFAAPGGGLANLDIWERLCADPATQIIMLLGEATFHQVHWNVTSERLEPRWGGFHAEYMRIRGKPYAMPEGQPLLFGRLHKDMLSGVAPSIETLRNKNPTPR
jgi:glycosyltransferase involved in cell wall biosynthesis